VLSIQETPIREDLCRLLPESRDNWADVALKLLRGEQHPQLLKLLVGILRSREESLLQVAVDQALANPRRQPALFTWLMEELVEDPLLSGRNPLRLIQDILNALRLTEFESYRGRLTALAEAGGSLPRLIALLGEDQAATARDALERAPLEEFLREPLINALELRHPQLRGDQPAGLYALPQSIAARKEELQQLLKVEIPANRKAIQEARELGDLSENFEYKSARQRQEYLSARVGKLQQELNHVVPLEVSGLPTSEVRPGLRVELRASGGADARSLTLLGPWESDPDRGVISYQSELGLSLLGKKVGEIVEMEGERLEIAAIRPLD
jgi:transcription elongation GreA/GreB family factor